MNAWPPLQWTLSLLGCRGPEPVWLQAWASIGFEIKPASARQRQRTLHWPGLFLKLRRTQGENHWGLHGLHYLGQNDEGEPPWAGEWPGGLSASATCGDVGKAFGPAELDTGDTLTHTLQGPDGRQFGVVSAFDDEGRLRELSLIRLEDWSALALPAETAAGARAPAPAPISTPAAPPAHASPIICGSRGIVPKTGLYRAWLPHDYHDAAYYNHTHTSYNYKQEGEVMGAVGVVPVADEALVIWVWVRAER